MFNVESYIEKCISSLLMQDIEKEIILINDGSTDRTLEISKKYAERYKEIIIISHENKGQSIARNEGIKIANGEYIFFCDADDYIDDNSLPQLYEICSFNNLDILRTGWKTHRTNNTYFNIPPKCLITNVSIDTFSFFKKSIKLWYNVGPGYGLFKTEFLNKHNLYFPEKIQFEDNTFYLKALLIDKETKVLQNDSSFYNGVVSKNSTTTSIPQPKKIYDQLKNVELMDTFISSHLKDQEIIDFARVAVSSLVFTMTSYYYRIDKKYRNKIYKEIPRYVLKDAIKYPQTKFQKLKLIMFTYFRFILDIYESLKRHND